MLRFKRVSGARPCHLLVLCLLQLHAASCTDENLLIWNNITDAIEWGALCNDFSPAGYFIRKGEHLEKKWVIFLESGGGCGSPRSCTERYITQSVRRDYQHYDSSLQSLVTDVEGAYRDHGHDWDGFTSKLMTSLWNFRKSPSHREFTQGNFSAEGRDILSPNVQENPLYFNYTHVVVPYCSSDLWLGASENYKLASNPDFQFRFSPIETENEFTFRGEAIFKAVIWDLLNLHNLDSATEVVLAGSSAGGVGVINYAHWVYDRLSSTGGSLSLLVDSAWFINFHGNMERRFSPDTLHYLGIPANHSCNDLSEGYPCCISAKCMLSSPSYYPQAVPTFAVFSLYDLYFLTDSLKSVSTERILDALRIVSEYGGEMNTTLVDTSVHNPLFSYFVPSCLQHVYFAVSSLWEGLLRDSGISEIVNDKTFGHIVRSGVWDSLRITTANSQHGSSIKDALKQWEGSKKNNTVTRLRDYCKGPHCNALCPETVDLGTKEPYLHIGYQWTIAGLVLGISIICVVGKMILVICIRRLDRQHEHFLHWLDSNPYKEHKLAASSGTKAISVACWNLKYWVKLSKKDLKKAESSNTVSRGRLMSIAAAYDSNLESGPRLSSRAYSEDSMPSDLPAHDIAETIQQFNASRLSARNGRKFQSGKTRSNKEKLIIQEVSTFFKPGELVAIMGPSGSGKTTFLDLLTGRRRTGRREGEIFVNGIAVDQVRDWYLANTGYVLQLAIPYYEELTVRENLSFAAQMRLPRSFKVEDRFMRIEQVMNDTGLISLANTVVGGATGAGLSGGQKRRLCVAIQLLSLPSLIFLDEPTSGLDAASSYELLCYLNKLANYNRSIILTIHQPRLEIFHMFHKIILLCQGKIAYHGTPDRAHEFFVSAHENMKVKLPTLESKNPADMIMDMLGNEQSRKAILQHYQRTGEPAEVESTVNKMKIPGNGVRKRLAKDSGFWNRIISLEARAMKRSKIGTQLYIPVIFIGYAILLGTVYVQSQNGTQIISGFGVFSCASGLFMFPLIYGYLYPAVKLFALEYADGVGKPLELVLQTFVRFITLSFLPLVLCAVCLYLLVVPYRSYSIVVIVQVAIFNLAMNQTWISMLVLIVCLTPTYCHRISPIVSAIAGFAGGFFVPPSLMPPWYIWLFYINPNYYGFSAMARILLNDLKFDCAYDSELECYPFSSDYIMEYFGLNTVQPFVHVMILLIMTVVYLVLAWLVVWLKHTHIREGLDKLRKAVKSKCGGSSECGSNSDVEIQNGFSDSQEPRTFNTTNSTTPNANKHCVLDPTCPAIEVLETSFTEDDDVFEIDHNKCSLSPKQEQSGFNQYLDAPQVIHPRSRQNSPRTSWRNQCLSGPSGDVPQTTLDKRARLWEEIEAAYKRSQSHEDQVTGIHDSPSGDFTHNDVLGVDSPIHQGRVPTPSITIEEPPEDDVKSECSNVQSGKNSPDGLLLTPAVSEIESTSMNSLQTNSTAMSTLSEGFPMGQQASLPQTQEPQVEKLNIDVYNSKKTTDVYNDKEIMAGVYNSREQITDVYHGRQMTADVYCDGVCVVYPIIPEYRYRTISGDIEMESTEV